MRVGLCLMLMLAMPAAAELRVEAEALVNGSVEEVWEAWTTTEGAITFFAPAANIEPRPDGAYEIFFSPNQPPGLRGADGMRILVFEPNRRLAFTWNAPPKFPEARRQRTRVTILLRPVDASHTRVLLSHDGFGEGEEWEQVHAYFEKAWTEVIMPRLVKRFESGPIDWSSR